MRLYEINVLILTRAAARAMGSILTRAAARAMGGKVVPAKVALWA